MELTSENSDPWTGGEHVSTLVENSPPEGTLPREWRWAVRLIGVAVGSLGVLGFVNSFARIQAAAASTFGGLAWTLPTGVDLGIAVFSAMDVVLAKAGLRPWWIRFVAPGLTAATVWLNVSGEPSWFGRIAHAVLPGLWVAAIEVTAHVIRRKAKLARRAGMRMDRIRLSRWLLSPVPTLALWRRMVLWEERSYQVTLRREHDRVLALTDLQDTYGRFAWRWKAPRRARALYRLGELSPSEQIVEQAEPEPEVQKPRKEAEFGEPLRRRRPTKRPAKVGGQKPVTVDVDELMTVGWQIMADLRHDGRSLTRDDLVAGLRKAGFPVHNTKAGVLLARLRTETPIDPVELETYRASESSASVREAA
jgi:Protein of unknown function (DUF2637)